MPMASTVMGPISTLGTASTYDFPSSGKPLSSEEDAHLRVSSGVTSLAVIPWPPRSMHGLTSCMGQLSRPRALLVATIAAIISFETSGESLAGLGPSVLAAIKAAAANTVVIIICASSQASEPPVLPPWREDEHTCQSYIQ